MMSDPRPAAVSAPAGEAPDVAQQKIRDFMLDVECADVPITGDPVRIDYDELWTLAQKHFAPAPASGAPDEDVTYLAEDAPTLRRMLRASQRQLRYAEVHLREAESRLAAAEREREAMREALVELVAATDENPAEQAEHNAFIDTCPHPLCKAKRLLAALSPSVAPDPANHKED